MAKYTRHDIYVKEITSLKPILLNLYKQCFESMFILSFAFSHVAQGKRKTGLLVRQKTAKSLNLFD